MALKRAIGIGGLTLIGVGGVIGSGWLFAPMLAAQLAGPAAIVSWIIAGFAILLLALAFAEVCSRLPVPGGLGRIPYLTHGRMTAAAMGWSAWLGYVAISTVEVTVMLQYLSGPLPWLADGHDLSLMGKLCGLVALAVMTLLNAFGVSFLIRLNSSLTYVKMVLPLVVAATIIVERFATANFTAHGGFAPCAGTAASPPSPRAASSLPIWASAMSSTWQAKRAGPRSQCRSPSSSRCLPVWCSTSCFRSPSSER